MLRNGLAMPRALLLIMTLRSWLLLSGLLLLVTALLILVGLVVAFFWMRSNLAQNNPQDSAGLEKQARNFFKAVYDLIRIYLWLVRYHVRRRIAKYTTIVFLVVGAIGVFEKLLELVGGLALDKLGFVCFTYLLLILILRRCGFRSRLLYAFGVALILAGGVGALEDLAMLASVASFFKVHSLEGLLGGLKQASEHIFTNTPTLMVLLTLEVAVIRHHLMEPAHHHMERTTLSALETVLTPLSQLNTKLSQAVADTSNQAAKETVKSLEKEYYDLLSTAMVSLLKERDVPDLNLSIMKFNKESGLLEVIYENNPNKFDHSFTLKPGEGNAGRAFQSGNPFYIPLISCKDAVELVPLEDKSRRMTPRLDVYVESQHPFKSMLSIPIAHKKLDMVEVVGVVNLSSEKKSAFHGSDFDIGSLIAVILSLMNQ